MEDVDYSKIIPGVQHLFCSKLSIFEFDFLFVNSPTSVQRLPHLPTGLPWNIRPQSGVLRPAVMSCIIQEQVGNAHSQAQPSLAGAAAGLGPCELYKNERDS